jgi:hypothetical protein
MAKKRTSPSCIEKSTKLRRTVAQFRNKDRMKSCTNAQNDPATHTNEITSELDLHRVTPSRKTFAILQINMQLTSIARILPAIRISGPIARVEN